MEVDAGVETRRRREYRQDAIEQSRPANDSRTKIALEPPLPGRFQIRNALTAATAARLLAERGFPVKDEAIERGIRSVRWPGRLERLSDRPAVYLDGTHNPAGAKELLKFWKENFAGRRIFLVYGAMRDKAVDEIAGLLFPAADSVMLTEPLQPRAISAPLLAEMTAHLAKESSWCATPPRRWNAPSEWRLRTMRCLRRVRSTSWATCALIGIDVQCHTLHLRRRRLQTARYKSLSGIPQTVANFYENADTSDCRWFSARLANLAVGRPFLSPYTPHCGAVEQMNSVRFHSFG